MIASRINTPTETRRGLLLDLWWQAGTLHNAIRRAWFAAPYGSPRCERLRALTHRSRARVERRGDRYDREF